LSPPSCLQFSALVGTFVGGTTSIATSWIGQQRLSKEQRAARDRCEREELYKAFIQEACKLYIDAYATLNRIRVLSSPEVVEEAHRALQAILDLYSTAR